MLRELRPRAALFENVTGLLTSPGRKRRGEFFNSVLSDIFRCGYDAEWQVISAAEFGARHLRKRVWIICYENKQGGASSYWNSDSIYEQAKRAVCGGESAYACGICCSMAYSEGK
jgi:DNA (cytosine-5)-methyltransferase 1